ncbi:dihydrofolate reductase family protein [Spiractinospora alimapuensis]|uniref:dihydrofolate reductase family protein n=1 Tax=Spiractinospora alimapuensis TaxID=2820884 RepID=UPI001F2342B3|nr:dihydrofolate reductase family protein [Spiractinospora alimapuensis]QVQ51846.1 dihydrofolate reductase family protein [Spiractinospora alimapuensis]
MRTLIYTAFVSLDGVVDSPGGGTGETHRSVGWTFQDIEMVEEAYEIKATEQEEAGALMLGRTSYQAFSTVWPDIEEFATYRTLPKYVVSTTLRDEDLVENWGETTILRSLDDVAAAKESDGAPIIVHGSATLARGLSDAGLLDRYHLLVFPVLLGAGKRMFSDTDKDKQPLRLVDSQAYRNGVQKMVFDVVG